ncbi:39S ribosomal protein L52, mitochondrial isoform X2 [Camelus ferus]|uniref:Large ribosomal subunit protein mL52 n=1 Tax=Camelus ferus TaxID=419612 RepID=A0A8B7K3V9_CAMFR|nr:39S ribosomal protein L52, mitochondrial isoform X2 [Camelus bactrianus]XP_010987720.2 39S ribosomal protein L52, mitochondrial isoform X2 [Camelus dromedarius]XP_014407150.2 39S ribosomal protein L52, mitochondrial isoform X2 [Camelus ferus]
MAASGFPRSVARGPKGHAHFRLLRLSMEALGILLSGVRRLHCGAAARAGGQWRLQQGLAANPSGYGTLTELPDWSYADGRPAPPMKGQLRRKAQREKFARRVVLLSQEMDAGLQAWQRRQQEKLQEEERKQKNALKPKGALLQKPQPSQ